MLYDPGFDHETGAPGLLPELGGVDEGPLPTTDWAQALLDRRGARLSEMALDADDARPETLPPEAFDPIARKDQDAFVLFTRTDPPVTRVPPVIVEGEYDPDPDPYDDWWETGDWPPGYWGDGPGFDGGSGGGGDGDTDVPAPDVPRDLSRKSCSELAYYEHRVDSDIRNSRGIVTTLLSALDPFQSDQIFDEIWSAFDRAYNQPGIDRIDPSFDLLGIWSDTRDPNSLISTSLRSMGVAIGAEIILFAAFDRLYQATLDKARIDAAQSTKGCSG